LAVAFAMRDVQRCPRQGEMAAGEGGRRSARWPGHRRCPDDPRPSPPPLGAIPVLADRGRRHLPAARSRARRRGRRLSRGDRRRRRRLIAALRANGASTSRRRRGSPPIFGRSRMATSAGRSPSPGRCLMSSLETAAQHAAADGRATALSFLLGSLLGVVAGARPGSFRDRLSCRSASLALYAVPGFWLGPGACHRLLGPAALVAAGRASRPSPRARPGWSARARHRAHLVLPVAALGAHLSRALSAHDACRHGRNLAAGFRACAASARPCRAGASCSPCRPQRAAAAGHDARPAVGRDARRQRRHRERLFHPGPSAGWPRRRCRARDTPLLLGIILISAVLVIVINLAVDIAYARARPARRRERGGA
jgi:hypothetical protein